MAKKPSKNSAGVRQIVNKKAFFNYEIIEKVEAGLVLLGTEVKSLRAGQADLEGAYARIRDGACRLVGCKIAQYPQASVANHPPLRSRKVLLHKRQITKLTGKLQQRGVTIVPLRLYFSERGFAKVELGLGRGKRQYDKRKQIQKREHAKDIDKSVKKYRAKKLKTKS